MKDLLIKTPTVEVNAGNLSGGNQQKVVVGKWLARNSRVVIFDEPTRGIDVGAKVEIYNLMNQLKKQGIAVMFVSSEMPEVLGIADRVIVMCDGRITGEVIAKETTQNEVLKFATEFEQRESRWMREDRMMNEKQSAVKRILGTRGMGAVITAFAGLIIIYVAFGLIDRKVFAGQNVMNLLRSMSKYLLIGVGQSYLLITGNIDLFPSAPWSGMSAMISATLMAMGVNPFVAIAVAMICCLVTGVWQTVC